MRFQSQEFAQSLRVLPQCIACQCIYTISIRIVPAQNLKLIGRFCRSLFQTQDFTWKSALKYIPIGIGLQCVAAYLYTALSWFLEQGGLSGVDADFSYFSSGKSVLMTILYTCILAPLTEELLYRGFLMKTLSRVSIRFGILISALAFGLAHGNPAQFLLGFLVGIFMASTTTIWTSLR